MHMTQGNVPCMFISAERLDCSVLQTTIVNEYLFCLKHVICIQVFYYCFELNLLC